MSEKVFQSNGYTYTVDEHGTITASGEVRDSAASRKGMENITPAGYDSSVTDKGHVIAARIGGDAADYNVTAQDRHLNRSGYKQVENAEVQSVKDGNTVHTEKIAYVSNDGSKPDAYMINDTITTPDGKTHTVNLSFQNMSPEEQQEMMDIVNSMPVDDHPNPDPLRESMTTEEYAQLMEETDKELENMSIRDEYDTSNVYTSNCVFETPFADEDNSLNSSDCTAVDNYGTESEVDSGTDISSDDGIDGGSDSGMDID